MASRELLALNESTSKIQAAQSGDDYIAPRLLNLSSSGIKFADGTTALTASTVGGSQDIDSVLGIGNTTTKDISAQFKYSAIAASLPALTFVDVAHFDNSKDPAWLDKCEDKSWYNETIYTGKQFTSAQYANDAAALAANPTIVADDIYFKAGVGFVLYSTGTTIYRAGSAKFPMKGFVTAEAGRVIVWDSTGASPTMWMVYITGGGGYHLGGSATISSVAIEQHYISVGTGAGLIELNLVESSAYYRDSAAGLRKRSTTTVDRNGASSLSTVSPSVSIVNNVVNDVAITYLPDAPLDEYGMLIPTIFANTDGGLSIIHNTGTVVDITCSTAAWTYGALVDAFGDSGVVFTLGQTGLNNRFIYVFNTLPTADTALTVGTKTGTGQNADFLYTGNTAYPSGDIFLAASGTNTITTLKSSGNKIYAGHSTKGLIEIIPNIATPAASIGSVATDVYQSGIQDGDIRRAFLANSKTVDRSVKAGTLVENGTVTETVNAGGVNYYGPFTAANNFTEATSADFNALATADWAIALWYKAGAVTGTQQILTIGDPALGANPIIGLQASSGGSGIARLVVSDDGNATFDVAADTSALSLTNYNFIVALRRGANIEFWRDGKLAATTTLTNAVASLSNALMTFNIGIHPDTSLNALGTVALVRFGVTAPTAEQIAFMYAQEKAIIEAGSLSLLSNAASVSALSYDKSTDVLSVGNGTAVDQFKGLKRLSAAAHGVTTLTALASGSGDKVVVGTGGSFARPAQDVNSELKATRLELAELKNSSKNYSFTSSGTTWALPAGWKADGTIFNVTDGTFAAVSQTFDGFIWTLDTLTTAKVHNVRIVRV